MAELRPPHAPIRVARPLEVGLEIDLDAGATKSIHFRGLNAKEAFTLRDAEGGFFRASVLELHASRARVAIYEALPVAPESPARITLVCAVLARQRMLTVMQKATELGATRILPVFSAHSVGPAGLEHEKAHAWPGQILRAARQCRRASVPELRATVPLEKVLDDPLWSAADRRLVLDDRMAPASDALRAEDDARAAEVVFAVGPEGGWSDDERALLSARGALALRLGGRVLRAETAVLVGLTVLQFALGDLAP
jgi:16S rRNA (uracil1498-N3)-methyltransferase